MSSARIGARLRAAAVLALCIVALSALPGRAVGAIYTVGPVSVDVTAESAAKAREQALAAAHERAFDRLIGRIVPERAQARVPDAGYERIATLVRDFEVGNEKRSSVRYLADLTIRFQRKAVRGFLREHDVPFAETRSDPLVVLPLYGEGGGAVLWQEPNPWRAAWANRGADDGLVPLEVPLGDLQDMQTVRARAALDLRWKPLSEIAARYGGKDVLITQAIPDGPSARRLQLVSRRVGAEGQEQTWVATVQRRADEARKDMFDRAAGRVARAVERSWKLANVVRFESEAQMRVYVPLDGLDRWVTVRRRLNGIPLVGDARLRRLSRAQAEVALVYYGDVAQLRRAMAQRDLTLTPTPSDAAGAGGDTPEWTLRPAGAENPRGAGNDAAAESGANGAGSEISQ